MTRLTSGTKQFKKPQASEIKFLLNAQSVGRISHLSTLRSSLQAWLHTLFDKVGQLREL